MVYIRFTVYIYVYVYEHQCCTYFITLPNATENWLHYSICELHENILHERLKTTAYWGIVVYYKSYYASYKDVHDDWLIYVKD